MMNPRHRISLALVLMSTASVAAAEGLGSGVYLGAALGKTYADIDRSGITDSLEGVGFTVVGSAKEDDDTGWKLYGGYQFNPYLGVEASWVDLGEYEADVEVGGGNPGTISSTLDLGGAFNLAVTGGYPFTERVRAFGKLGVVFWDAEAKSTARLERGTANAKDDDNGSDLSFGLGASYAVTEHIAVRIDWDRYQIGGDADTDTDFWSFAVQYQF